MHPAILEAMPSVVRRMGGKWTALGGRGGPVWANVRGGSSSSVEPWMREPPSQHRGSIVLSRLAAWSMMASSPHHLSPK